MYCVTDTHALLWYVTGDTRLSVRGRFIFASAEKGEATKDIGFRFRFTLEGVENDLLLLQMRVYDRKRLLRKIGVMPKVNFQKLLDALKALL